jgi:YVTN family beta-propeller protein
LSVVNTATRHILKEVVFFKPGQSAAVGEYPYWPAVISSASGNLVKAYVTSLRDGQVLVVNPSGLTKVIKVGGEPNRILLTADQKQLYVANGDLDEIEVIDTTSDSVVDRISLARPGYPYKGSWPNSLALSPDGRTLYVTLGGENAVGVIDVPVTFSAGSHSDRLVPQFGHGECRRQASVRSQYEGQFRA